MGRGGSTHVQDFVHVMFCKQTSIIEKHLPYLNGAGGEENKIINKENKKTFNNR